VFELLRCVRGHLRWEGGDSVQEASLVRPKRTTEGGPGGEAPLDGLAQQGSLRKTEGFVSASKSSGADKTRNMGLQLSGASTARACHYEEVIG